jgi:hypothetical protein
MEWFYNTLNGSTCGSHLALRSIPKIYHVPVIVLGVGITMVVVLVLLVLMIDYCHVVVE